MPIKYPNTRSFIGKLEGLISTTGLAGWAAQANSEDVEPLLIQLTLEDLLNPACRWKLAEVSANRPRPDLMLQGVKADCGFLFLGHSGRDLPPAAAVWLCVHFLIWN